MKYQEALNRIAKYCGANNGSMLEDDLKTLQELVDKATPKKVIVDDSEFDKYGANDYVCPNCNSIIGVGGGLKQVVSFKDFIKGHEYEKQFKKFEEVTLIEKVVE